MELITQYFPDAQVYYLGDQTIYQVGSHTLITNPSRQIVWKPNDFDTFPLTKGALEVVAHKIQQEAHKVIEEALCPLNFCPNPYAPIQAAHNLKHIQRPYTPQTTPSPWWQNNQLHFLRKGQLITTLTMHHNRYSAHIPAQPPIPHIVLEQQTKNPSTQDALHQLRLLFTHQLQLIPPPLSWTQVSPYVHLCHYQNLKLKLTFDRRHFHWTLHKLPKNTKLLSLQAKLEAPPRKQVEEQLYLWL